MCNSADELFITWAIHNTEISQLVEELQSSCKCATCCIQMVKMIYLYENIHIELARNAIQKGTCYFFNPEHFKENI